MMRISMLGSASKTALSVRDWYRILSRASLEFEISSRRKIWFDRDESERESKRGTETSSAHDGKISFAKKASQRCTHAKLCHGGEARPPRTLPS